jgi:rRNA maturation RNase YbeY
MIDADFHEFSEIDITFNYQDTLPFNNNEGKSIRWIYSIINDHNFAISALNYIFCNDEQLHKINVEHLGHDTYTDIITFDYSDEAEVIEGDIYISLDRVRSNAEDLGKTFDDELHRVLVHGVLHLIGYNDKSDDEKNKMRNKEDACLAKR